MINDWKLTEREVADIAKRISDATPEPLFETYYMPGRAKVCLVCANRAATSTLWSSFVGRSVIPMCKECSNNWNFYGYYILKRIVIPRMVWRLLKYKIFHPFGRPTPIDIALDVMSMLRWSRKMTRLKNGIKA